MLIASCHLEGISPYSQSKHYVVPKLGDGKESSGDYEDRTWRERLHVDESGHVFIPPMAFKNCIAEGAKYLGIQIPGKGKSNYTKHFEAGVLVTDPLVLPIKKDDVPKESVFVPSDGRRGGSSRVTKHFGVIHKWSGVVPFMILDPIITKDVFRRVLDESGKFIGIGRFRPRNNGFYGRFTVKDIKWSEE